MKSVYLLLLLWLVTVSLQAQNCGVPQSLMPFNNNNINTVVGADGSLFSQGSSQAFFRYQGVGAIFSAGIWAGGLDEAGNLKLSAVDFKNSSTGFREYSAGPLDPFDGTISASNCLLWDRHFVVMKRSIDSFALLLPQLSANPTLAATILPSIMKWPGKGNPYFSDLMGFTLPPNQNLAPFFDRDGDGLYNPLIGDYPVVQLLGKSPFVPAQFAWCVFNDNGSFHQVSQGAPLKMEYQLSTWAFDSTESAPFSNTIFTSHKMIYRGTDNLTETFVGIQADVDLGCPIDDYVGCNPAKNTFFVYNQDNVDGQFGTECALSSPPILTFGEDTPVLTGTILNRPMDRFIYYNSPSGGFGFVPQTIDPANTLERYNLLTGRWLDGLPITRGGNGYNPDSTNAISFAFPDPPADANGWSMCTANMVSNDRRVIPSISLETLQPGAINELTMAWTIHPSIVGPCNLGNALDNVTIVQNAYENSFESLVSVKNSASSLLQFRVAPNPANQLVQLSYPTDSVSAIFCYDMQGKLIATVQNPAPSEQLIDLSGWAEGMYMVQLVGKGGTAVAKLMVSR
jgi:Secretion system C-terminal sorting domain